MTTRRSNRRLATMDVPLEPLHAAANLHGGHVNDAFLAAITGGLRRYHERHGAAADELRMTLPVSIRKPDDPIGGNRITLLRFALPVAEPDPAARIRVAHERVSAWRNEPAIPLTQAIAFGLNLAPRSYVQGILRRVDFVASDVPGLEQPVYLAGARLLGYYPFGPTIGAAVNTTLLSYVDSCCVGVNVDDSAVPDLEEFMVDLHAGFDEVLALAVPRHRRSRTDGVVPHRRGERQAVAAR